MTQLEMMADSYVESHIGGASWATHESAYIAGFKAARKMAANLAHNTIFNDGSMATIDLQIGTIGEEDVK